MDLAVKNTVFTFRCSRNIVPLTMSTASEMVALMRPHYSSGLVTSDLGTYSGVYADFYAPNTSVRFSFIHYSECQESCSSRVIHGIMTV